MKNKSPLTGFVALTFWKAEKGARITFKTKDEWLNDCISHAINIKHSYLINLSDENSSFLNYWSLEEGLKVVTTHLIGDSSLVYKLVKVLGVGDASKDVEYLTMIENLLGELKAEEIVRIATWLLDKYKAVLKIKE